MQIADSNGALHVICLGAAGRLLVKMNPKLSLGFQISEETIRAEMPLHSKFSSQGNTGNGD